MMSPAQPNPANDELRTIGQPDFTRPIELLMDCHRRIERFLEVLQQFAVRVNDGQLSDHDRQTLATGLNYFQQAAPRHTTDEEQSLFPRLRQCADVELRATLVEVDRLETDHRRAEVVHQRIDEIGRSWLQAGHLDPSDACKFQSLLKDLANMYHDHIRVEDERVYATTTQILTAEELRTVGAEMFERRIADPGRAGSRCATRRRLQTDE